MKGGTGRVHPCGNHMAGSRSVHGSWPEGFSTSSGAPHVHRGSLYSGNCALARGEKLPQAVNSKSPNFQDLRVSIYHSGYLVFSFIS